jgi:hypothetical protein
MKGEVSEVKIKVYPPPKKKSKLEYKRGEASMTVMDANFTMAHCMVNPCLTIVDESFDGLDATVVGNIDGLLISPTSSLTHGVT